MGGGESRENLHDKKVKLGLVRRVKDGRGGKVRRRVHHGVDLLVKAVRADLDVGGEVVGDLVRDAVQHGGLAPVAVLPPGLGHQVRVLGGNGVVEVGQVALLRGRVLLDLFVDGGEEAAVVVLVDARLREALGDDGGLRPFEAVHELEVGV